MYNNWVTDPEVSRFWSWEPHKSIDVTKAILEVWIDEYENLENYHWIIIYKQNMQAIGYIYLNNFDDINGGAQIHYALSRKYWNMGIMTEACKRVINFAFSDLNAKIVKSCHHSENPASGRVMIKCGMRLVEIKHREIPDYKQISGDYCYYEITAGNWKNNEL